MSTDTPPLVFLYTNWRGEAATRHVRPLRVEYGPEPRTTCEMCNGSGRLLEFVADGSVPCGWCRGTGQRLAWLLVAYDLDRGAERSFALDKINGGVR